jgi:hypothetical protein
MPKREKELFKLSEKLTILIQTFFLKNIMLSQNEMKDLVGDELIKDDDYRMDTRISTPFDNCQFDIFEDDYMK